MELHLLLPLIPLNKRKRNHTIILQAQAFRTILSAPHCAHLHPSFARFVHIYRHPEQHLVNRVWDRERCIRSAGRQTIGVTLFQGGEELGFNRGYRCEGFGEQEDRVLAVLEAQGPGCGFDVVVFCL